MIKEFTNAARSLHQVRPIAGYKIMLMYYSRKLMQLTNEVT